MIEAELRLRDATTEELTIKGALPNTEQLQAERKQALSEIEELERLIDAEDSLVEKNKN